MPVVIVFTVACVGYWEVVGRIRIVVGALYFLYFTQIKSLGQVFRVQSVMIILSIVIGALVPQITATPDSNTTGDGDIDDGTAPSVANGRGNDRATDRAGIAAAVNVCLIVAAVCYAIAGLSLVRAGTLRHKISASLGGALVLATVSLN